MPISTTTYWVVLALVLIGGWLLGLASHPGGRRWRERYTTERDAHAVTRRDAEARVTAASSDADTRLAEANRRIADLERDHARLVAAAPVTAATIAPAATTAPVATTPSGDAYPMRITPDDTRRV